MESKSVDDLLRILDTTLKTNGGKLFDAKSVLDNYSGTDWEKHVKYCDVRYTRNIIARNDIVEIVLICWKKAQKSGIHDHPSNGCLMKVLKGCLNEDVYVEKDGKFELTKTNALCGSNIGYQIGSKGLHDISATDTTVSLHVYSPPGHKTKFHCVLKN